MTYHVLKYQKRMYIADQDGNKVYSPPDFIYYRINMRAELNKLVQCFNSADDVFDCIYAFESEFYKGKRVKK